MMVILSLKSESPTDLMSLPSMKIVPWLGSKIQQTVRHIVDLPDPVLPTSPIFCPP